MLPGEEVGHVAGFLVDIFERQIESSSVPEHRLVQVVDQLAAALGDLARKEPAERPAPAAGPRVGVVECRSHPALGQRVATRQAGETGANDPHVHGGCAPPPGKQALHRGDERGCGGGRSGAADRLQPVATALPGFAAAVAFNLSHPREGIVRRDTMFLTVTRDSQRAHDVGKQGRTTHALILPTIALFLLATAPLPPAIALFPRATVPELKGRVLPFLGLPAARRRSLPAL